MEETPQVHHRPWTTRQEGRSSRLGVREEEEERSVLRRRLESRSCRKKQSFRSSRDSLEAEAVVNL